MERTLSIVKPDGIKKGILGEVIVDFSRPGSGLPLSR